MLLAICIICHHDNLLKADRCHTFSLTYLEFGWVFRYDLKQILISLVFFLYVFRLQAQSIISYLNQFEKNAFTFLAAFVTSLTLFCAISFALSTTFTTFFLAK